MLARRPEVHIYIPGITASNEKEKGKRVAERGNATEMGVNGSGYTPGTTPSPPRRVQPVEKKRREQEDAKEMGANEVRMAREQTPFQRRSERGR